MNMAGRVVDRVAINPSRGIGIVRLARNVTP
jgi:hypothetical protein